MSKQKTQGQRRSSSRSDQQNPPSSADEGARGASSSPPGGLPAEPSAPNHEELALRAGAALAAFVHRAVCAGDVCTLDSLARMFPDPSVRAARDLAVRATTHTPALPTATDLRAMGARWAEHA